MVRVAAALLLAAVAIAARAQGAPRAEPPTGFVAAQEGGAELLGAPVRVGERVQRPEGWYRVEEAGPEDGAVGSFAVVPAARVAPAPAEPRGAPAALGASTQAEAGAALPNVGVVPVAEGDPCRAERSAYLTELLRTQGVVFEDPAGLLEGLEGERFATRLADYWLAFSIDPLRPLAWDPELRDRGAALARCAGAR